VIDFVSRADGLALGLVVFALVLGESLIVTDFVIPGEVGLVIAGAAAARNGTPLPVVVGAAACGAVAGDTIGYLVGRHFGTGLVERGRWLRRLRPTLQRARHHFERHGGLTVAGARWVGALRGAIPVVAGSARFPAPRLYAASVPSALVWSAAVAAIGFLWGDDVADVVDRVGLALSVIVVVAIVTAVVVVRRRRAQHQPA
jgi:membrane-associated protein